MQKIAKFLLKMMGWKAMDGVVPEPKCLILGVPHTSGWDFIISYLFYTSIGGKANVMVKKEFFWGPFGPLLRALGGVPVDRSKGASVVRSTIAAINKAETIHLAIAPEGTRQKTERWKTGFHTIAKACDIPVYLGYFDWGRKQVGRGVKFTLTDDVQGDLKKIRQHYKDLGVIGKNNECFTTGSDLEQ